MPPVLEELGDRILRLQGELADAMRDLPRPNPRRTPIATASTLTPSYIDRRL